MLESDALGQVENIMLGRLKRIVGIPAVLSKPEIGSTRM